MKTNPNDSAFSMPETVYQQCEYGLTKKEMFAAMAMQGLCLPAIPREHNANSPMECKLKAEMAVRLADALIEELNKEKGEL